MFEKAKNIVKKNSKILHLTHAYCADGSGCSIMLMNAPLNVTTIPVKYDEIDSVLKSTMFDKYDAVIITDISPKNKESLELANNIILLDHHETALKYHNEDTMKYVTQDFCGTVLTCQFLEEVLNIDLSYLYEFIELTNDYDLWLKEDERSTYLNMLYYELWHEKYVKRFLDGNIKFTNDEKNFITNRKKEIDEYYKNLKIYDIGLKDGCFIKTNKFVNDLCNSLHENEDYKIILSYNENNGNLSIRSWYDNLNIGLFLEKLGFGGGHAKAGGITEKDYIILMEKVTTLVKELKIALEE